MRSEATEFLPKARREAIITKEVDGELLVYDRERDRAHCLNETAAAIWRLCDGRTSVSEIALNLQKAEGSRQKAEGSDPTPDTRRPTPDTQVVWLALDQLQRSHLLEEINSEAAQQKTFWPPAIGGITNMSRREAVRRIGLGAAIALPIVMSMTAPTAVEAALSCGHHCASCSTSADCCGVCTTGVPGCTTGMHCT